MDAFQRRSGFYECTAPLVGAVFLHGKPEDLTFYVGVKSYLPQFMTAKNLEDWNADWKVPLIGLNSTNAVGGKASVLEPASVYQTVNVSIHLEPE